MLVSEINELKKKVADLQSAPVAAVAPQTSLKTLRHLFQLTQIHDSESLEEQKETTICMINEILEQELSQKEKDLPITKKLHKIFIKLGETLQDLSKDDVRSVIRKVPCEKPKLVK